MYTIIRCISNYFSLTEYPCFDFKDTHATNTEKKITRLNINGPTYTLFGDKAAQKIDLMRKPLCIEIKSKSFFDQDLLGLKSHITVSSTSIGQSCKCFSNKIKWVALHRVQICLFKW